MFDSPRPIWFTSAELPTLAMMEAWTVEARALGFDDYESGSLCFWRWLTALSPVQIG